jgi:EpsI family protein
MPAKSPPRYVPVTLLALGCLLLFRVGQQQALPLRAPLASLPQVLLGFEGHDDSIPEEEQAVAGMSDYLLRSYGSAGEEHLSVYVGYYPSQTQGHTIHSPKNCLPGSGWEPLAARVDRVAAGGAMVSVNRYLLANGERRALVYYWYQGRGRVAANEYRVKLDLLHDATFRGRTEEALVRIVIPLTRGVSDSLAEVMLQKVAAQLIPQLREVLPA